jgi:membrane associated rhomboid family serine protease
LIPLKDNLPTRAFPILTVAIIVINVLVYFGFQDGRLGLPENDTKTVEYSAIPYEITHPGKECGLAEGGSGEVLCEGQEGVSGDAPDQPPTWATIFFAMFMHGSLLHIAGNMLFLWVFGNNIEDSMGKPRFIAFYLLGGIAAMLAQTVVDPNSTTPTLGASGAIAAVLGGYALLYPRARVLTLIFIIFFFTIIELPALFVLGGWFLLQILDGATVETAGGGGVAYFAHIGGFLFGLAAIRLFANRVRDDYVQPRLPVY